MFKNFKTVAAIVAIDDHFGIGRTGAIPWHFKRDFKWFRGITKGAVCVMGRTTYEHIAVLSGDRAVKEILPGRQTYVLSQTLTSLPNATVVKDWYALEALTSQIEDRDNIFMLGGSDIYSVGLQFCDTAFITRIAKAFGCDRFFPAEKMPVDMKVDVAFPVEENDTRLLFEVYRTPASTYTFERGFFETL